MVNEDKMSPSKILPNSNAASEALTANWFSMSLGKNAANPEMSRPSEAPAKFKNKNVGFRSNAMAARGSSLRALNAADFDAAPSCASEIFDALISSAPVNNNNA